MPIEIKELHIRVAVDAPTESSSAASQSPAAAGQQGGGTDAEAIIAECVEQVLQVLQNKSER